MPCVESIGPDGYSVTARHNDSLTRAGKVFALSFIASVALAIALGFTWAGAWPILPFAGAEVIALVFAFSFFSRRKADFERLTIAGDRLTLERRECGRMTRTAFHRYWAQLLVRSDWRGCRLSLRSHGREVEFGRFLSDEQRLALAGSLRARLGRD